MPLVYRTTGAWGAGVGRPLTTAEIDQNFKYMNDRLRAVLANRPVMVDTAVLTNNRLMTITMENDTEFTFDMPSSPLVFQGEWTDSTEYSKYDVVSNGGAIYLVSIDHVSNITFNAGDTNAFGADLYNRLSSDARNNQGVTLINDYTTGFEATTTPVLADANKLFVFEFYDEDPFFELPLEASVDYPIGTRFDIFSWGDHNVEVIFATGMTINAKTGCNFKTETPGSFITLIKVGEDEWDLNGETGTTP